MTLALNVPSASLTDVARLSIDTGAEQPTKDGAAFGAVLSAAKDMAAASSSSDEADQADADSTAAIPAAVPADALAMLAMSGLAVDPAARDSAARASTIATRDVDLQAALGAAKPAIPQLDPALRPVADSGTQVAAIGDQAEGSSGAASDLKLDAAARESRTRIAIPLEEFPRLSDSEAVQPVRDESAHPESPLGASPALSTHDSLRAQLAQAFGARSEDANERSNTSTVSRSPLSMRADLAAASIADASALALRAHETVPEVAKPSAKADGPSYAQQAAAATMLATTPSGTGVGFVRSIATPVNEPGFGEEVANALTHGVTRGHDRIELRLHPGELGPVDVRIDYKAGEATLVIMAPQPSTRDALEQALPQLRDQLAFQGIALAEATVRDGTPDRQPPFDAPRAVSDQGELTPPAAPAPAGVLPRAAGRGLVDTFA